MAWTIERITDAVQTGDKVTVQEAVNGLNLMPSLALRLTKAKEQRVALLEAAKFATLTAFRQGSNAPRSAYEMLEKAIALAEGKTGGRLPYEKPRIIDEFPVTTAA